MPPAKHIKRTIFVKSDDTSIIVDGLLVKKVGDIIVHLPHEGPPAKYQITGERPTEAFDDYQGTAGRQRIHFIYDIVEVARDS